MEKIELKVSIEAIRLDALQFYLSSKENTTPQKALEKMLTEMYEKYVPAETRLYLDSKLKPAAVSKPRPKRPPQPAAPKAETAKEENQ